MISQKANLKSRNSSIELYRIIATITVLVVHFNGWFVGMPEKYDCYSPTLFRTGQMIIEASTCICVNMFLIISGYFGIRLKLVSILKLCLILMLIYVPFYAAEILLGGVFSCNALIEKFFVISNAGYFIQGYLMLMFFSPVLNSFVEKYGRKVLPWTVLFIGVEFWFETVRGIDFFGFNKGYSIIHFVIMYMVARCIALYEDNLLVYPKKCWLVGYVIATIIICFMYIGGMECAFAYSNPVVIVSSICTFIPFLYKEWHNRNINWIAGGTLAVYIIQVTDPAYSILVKLDNYLLDNNTYFLYLLLCGLVISVTFWLCVFYQKICDWMISPVFNRLPSIVRKCELK